MPPRFPANCLLVALAGALLTRGSIATLRNRTGRLHWFWRDRSGRAWEFYTAGASRRTYLRNALTLGEVRACPALDRPN